MNGSFKGHLETLKFILQNNDSHRRIILKIQLFFFHMSLLLLHSVTLMEKDSFNTFIKKWIPASIFSFIVTDCKRYYSPTPQIDLIHPMHHVQKQYIIQWSIGCEIWSSNELFQWFIFFLIYAGWNANKSLWRKLYFIAFLSFQHVFLLMVLWFLSATLRHLQINCVHVMNWKWVVEITATPGTCCQRFIATD